MNGNRIILLIVLGVFVWGVFHAIGAYTYNHNPLRFWVVLGTSCAFLAFWLALLASRRSRLRREGNSNRWSQPKD